MQVDIRGINTGRDAETNFALVIDGVLQTNPNALNQELSGITPDRGAEGSAGRALRPQRLGRALILTTRKPGDDLGTRYHAGYRLR